MALADQFQEIVDSLPSDWTDLELDLRVQEDRYVEAAYFTNEAEARAGEQVVLPDELQAAMADFQQLMANTEFLDLTDPQLR